MMELTDHNLNSLFDQLGLDHSDEAIETFIRQHKPLGRILLYEADFWSRAQAAFLKQAVEDDADWAIVVDQLDSLLR